MCKIIILT